MRNNELENSIAYRYKLRHSQCMIRMPATLILALAAITAFLGSQVNAQVRDEDECLKLHPEIESPVEMATCTSDSEAAEESMQKAFRTLLQQLKARPHNRYFSPVRQLRAAQESWMRYRDAECKYQGGIQNTAGTSNEIFCKADMNRARTDALRAELAE
ncbi:MAG: DUF1311 domain-containing protein [Sphingomonadaceae bacterium]|nr:DUF1311 domain-containing protein [Sphingomonadaceae bacterium]